MKKARRIVTIMLCFALLFGASISTKADGIHQFVKVSKANCPNCQSISQPLYQCRLCSSMGVGHYKVVCSPCGKTTYY